jgi:hypothetical protein
LGFVSERYSRHAGLARTVINGSFGAIATGNDCFRLRRYRCI